MIPTHRIDLDRLMNESGRDYETCLFCLRYQHWDYDQALKMSKAHPRESTTEADRRSFCGVRQNQRSMDQNSAA